MMAHRELTFLEYLKEFNLDVCDEYDPGAMAIFCPACPQPGVNMDPNWKDTPPEKA